MTNVWQAFEERVTHARRLSLSPVCAVVLHEEAEMLYDTLKLVQFLFLPTKDTQHAIFVVERRLTGRDPDGWCNKLIKSQMTQRNGVIPLGT